VDYFDVMEAAEGGFDGKDHFQHGRQDLNSNHALFRVDEEREREYRKEKRSDD
jgi:hypothetical protein